MVIGILRVLVSNVRTKVFMVKKTFKADRTGSCRAVTIALLAVTLLAGCSRVGPGPKRDTTQVVTEDAATAAEPEPAQSASASTDNVATPTLEDPESTEDAIAAPSDACASDVGVSMSDGAPQTAIPDLKRRVTDQTDRLTPECVVSLNDRLARLEQDKGAQVAVLLVNSTGDDDINAYAVKVFEHWKLGRKGVDDGVLLVASMGDRHARIEVGYGLEDVLTDAISGDILRENLRPNFADHHYNAGVSATVDALIGRIESAPLAAVRPKRSNKTAQWVFFGLMVALCIAAGAVGAALNLRWYYRVLLPPVVSTVCALVGVPLHLSPGYSTIVGMIPASLMFSVPGLMLVRATRQVLQWIGCWLASSSLISITTLLVGRARGNDWATMAPWMITCIPVGVFVGTLVFIVAFVLRGARKSSSNGWMSGRDDSSSSSISSSDDSSSSSGGSSSSDSGGTSGGGGESGGGGASTDW